MEGETSRRIWCVFSITPLNSVWYCSSILNGQTKEWKRNHPQDELMEKGFTIDRMTKEKLVRIAECLLTPGEINLSWNDISDVLLQDGETVIAFDSGTGKSRWIKACSGALSNYRTASQMARRTKRLLFRVVGPENLLLKEVNDAKKMIEGSLCPTSEVVFGVARDESLKDEVRITIIAT